MLRAAIYVRVSSEEQAEEGYSIAAQRRALADYAQKQGWTIVAEYIEEGVSGRTDKRPAFQAMLSAAKERPRPFDIVLVHKMDRFARNRDDSVHYKALFRKKLDIDVRSITEQFDDSPVGRMTEGFLEVLGEFYSANLATEVLKGQRERARAGCGMCVPPIGYVRCSDANDRERNGRYLPDPETAPIVRWIFETYCQGESGMNAIAKTLAREGIRRFGGAAGRYTWTTAFIGKILANRAYMGELIWGQRNTQKGRRLRPRDEWVIVPNAHEALVDAETWEQAATLRQSRQRTNLPREGKDYLLRGLLRCLDCRRNMIRYNYQWVDKKTGERSYRPSAICTGYTRYHTCYCNRIPLDEIEADLFADLRDLMRGNADCCQVVVVPKPTPTAKADPVAELTKRLEAEDVRYQRALDGYLNGVLDLDKLRQEKEQWETSKARLQGEIAKLKTAAQPDPAETAEAVKKAVMAIWDTATDESVPLPKRRQALSTIVHSVHVSRRENAMKIWYHG